MDLSKEEEEQMELPPGFRFHPTDEELITHYLSEKIANPEGFTARAIGDVDLNKCEPWDLPCKAKMGGEEEWYFFCVRDRKYPTGMRTNRATDAGYWKATGKDKEINRGKSLVGMKKTLVFYRGRAPKGEKTNWVIHEYRLEGKYSIPKAVKNEWVICRVFNKSSGGKKTRDELASSPLLPPLIDVVPYASKNRGSSPSDQAHVTCFSNSMEAQKGHEDLLAEYLSYNPPFFTAASASASPSGVSSSALALGKMALQSSFYANEAAPSFGSIQYTPASLMQILQGSGYVSMKQSSKPEMEILSVSQETGLTSDMNPEISSVVSNNEMGRHSFDGQEHHPSASAGHLHLDHTLWDY